MKPVSNELLKQYEIALIEVERLRAQLAGKDEIIRLKGEEIEAHKAIDDINRQRIQALLDAVKERTTANTLDEKRVELFRQSLDEFKAEVERLRRERDSLRKNRNMWTVAGAVFGIAVGVFLKSNN